MTPGLFVLVALGGGLGATLRFVVDGAVARVAGKRYPWGILVVNVSGSLLLGFVTGLALDLPWLFVLGAGLLGGYTTFSTAMIDTAQLLQRRAPLRAVANTFGMLVATVLVAFAGLLLGRVV